MTPVLEYVEAQRFEEAFIFVERHERGERTFTRSFRRESGAAREARYQRTLDAHPDELLVVFALMFVGDDWVASREIACWRGVRCRVRAQTKARWQRVAPASEQPCGVDGGEATDTTSRGCSGAGALAMGGDHHGS